MPRPTMSRSPSLKDLEARYGASDGPIPPSVLARLAKDPRSGARKLYQRLKRRRDELKQEKDRVDGMLHFERVLWSAGLDRVAGVDEVGIGPMAGPVVAAAVVFPPGAWIGGVDDSKRLKPETRERLEASIRTAAQGVGVGVVEPEEVDRLNVYHAGIRAMRLAVDALPVAPEHVLVDSRTIPDLGAPQTSFVKGDGLSFSIACASIVAKVYRDRLMIEMDRLYPAYGFASHKGYCSPAHQAAVRRLGPSPIHRRSFDFIREISGEYGSVFYEMKEKVRAARSRRELEEWESGFEQKREKLSQEESRKLRILAARRWRGVAGT